MLVFGDEDQVSKPQRYTAFAMFFHWTVGLLIILNFSLALLVSYSLVSDEVVRPILNFHKSTGMLILVLMVLRLGWRVTHAPPVLPDGYKPWEKSASHFVHIALYVVAFALPLSGWIHESLWKSVFVARFPWKWYGLFTPPKIGFLIHLPPDVKEMWHVRLGLVHAYLADVLYVLLALHVLGALKHQLLDRESELQRMLPWGK